ncbi:unnamed protein product [Symbiodinium sp. CCMP2592]|nr:unnamed protein product [Symbiodinium sp. CCMP2592]
MKAEAKGCELFDAHREFLMEKRGGKRKRGSKTHEPAVRQDPEWRQSLQASMSIPKKAFDRLINDVFHDLQKTMDDEMENASKMGCGSGDGDIPLMEFVASVFSDCTVLRKRAKRSETVYKADVQLLMGIRSGRLFEQAAEDAEQAYRSDRAEQRKIKESKRRNKRAGPDPEANAAVQKARAARKRRMEKLKKWLFLCFFGCSFSEQMWELEPGSKSDVGRHSTFETQQCDEKRGATPEPQS